MPPLSHQVLATHAQAPLVRLGGHGGMAQHGTMPRRCQVQREIAHAHASLPFTLMLPFFLSSPCSRSCGLIHCGSCSRYRSPVPSKNYHDRVRVCGKCYYGLKKVKRASSGGSGIGVGGGGGGGGGSDSGATSPRSGSGTPNPEGDSPTVVKSRTASYASLQEVQSQLHALQTLHSSYQPEHQALASLLANSDQMERAYVATIQLLHAQLHHQQQAHHADWTAQQAIITTQQQKIEQLEEMVRSGATSAAPNGLLHTRGASPVPPSTAAASQGYSTTPSSRASTGTYGLSHPSLGSQQHHSSLSSSPIVGAASTPTATSASTSSVAALAHISLASPLPGVPLPPLPTAFASLGASSSQHSLPPTFSPTYDPSSEFAYLEMEELSMTSPPPAPVPVTSTAAAAQHAFPAAANTGATSASSSHSSRHSLYKSSVLTVTEPPSPPPVRLRERVREDGPTSGGSGGSVSNSHRVQRAVSNPTATGTSTSTSSSAQTIERRQNSASGRQPRATSSAHSSVHSLLDTVGL